MLLTLTTTHQPATDLGYLLRKNPARLQSFSLPLARRMSFIRKRRRSVARSPCWWRLTRSDWCAIAGARPAKGERLEQYVNDRPYVASSFLSVAIAEVFGSALVRQKQGASGTGRHTIAAARDNFRAAVPGRRGVPAEAVRAAGLHRDPRVGCRWTSSFPEWGESAYHRVELECPPAAANNCSRIFTC